MIFWGILACCLLIPAVLLVAGEWMVRRPPQKINGLVGYRTTRECWRWKRCSWRR